MMSCPSKAQPLAILKSNPSELLYTCCPTKFWEGGQSGQYPAVIKHIIVSEIFFLVNFVGEIKKIPSNYEDSKGKHNTEPFQ